METGINAPIKPISAPSIRNGHLINQFVAPTNFMISISVLLEKMVIRMVLAIKNTAVNIRAMIIMTPTFLTVSIIVNKRSAVAPP